MEYARNSPMASLSFYLTDKFLQIVYGDFLLADECRDGSELRLAEQLGDGSGGGTVAVVLAADARKVFVASGADGAMGEEAFLLEYADKGRQRVDMWLRLIVEGLQLTDGHLAVLPDVAHYLLFLCCKCLHVDWLFGGLVV